MHNCFPTRSGTNPCLAVLVEYSLRRTDGQTDGQTDTRPLYICRASIASRSFKIYNKICTVISHDVGNIQINFELCWFLFASYSLTEVRDASVPCPLAARPQCCMLVKVHWLVNVTVQRTLNKIVISQMTSSCRDRKVVSAFSKIVFERLLLCENNSSMTVVSCRLRRARRQMQKI